MPAAGDREATLTADCNAKMIQHMFFPARIPVR